MPANSIHTLLSKLGSLITVILVVLAGKKDNIAFPVNKL
jgi:hypothetical protein